MIELYATAVAFGALFGSIGASLYWVYFIKKMDDERRTTGER